ncbi:MAG: extracellular solute-binding protein [Clostridia bacterium]|nr:extracellular solute-binding protein [Clostridia bacterium]
MRKFRSVLIGLVCVAAVIALVVFLDAEPENFRAKYEGTDLSQDVSGIGRSDTYGGYLRAHQNAPKAEEGAKVDVLSFEGNAEILSDEDGSEYVYTSDSSYVTWKVNVAQSGMYNIRIDYMAGESRGVDVERELYINGELPFAGAGQLTFNRLWTDAGEVTQDNQGNDIRPSQKEVFAWQKAFLKDDMGYQIEPYQFYLEKGENTISLKSVNEPMKIRAMELLPVAGQITYEEYLSAQPEASMSEEAKKFSVTIQGEDAYLRSSPSLYARYDRSSADTKPYSVKNTVLNYIGGDPWRTAGQWIEWEFEVPEDGYYAISVKARQAYQRGSVSARSLYIDGEIPFEEASIISFDYDTSWELYTLSDENGTPYKFYLEKGAHTIRLEATLGEMGTILSQIEESIYRLNLIYRKILVLTGVNPDRFRDYNLAKVYPDVLEAMDLESKRLYKLVDDSVAITGQKSDRVAVAQTLANQLEKFCLYNERITKQFTNFKDNITSLGTAMQNMSECKLDIDLLIVSGEDAKLPKVRDGFVAKAIHEIRSCVMSFFVDYNSLGNKYEEGEEEDLIEVWIVTGRDQSTVLKTMIDDNFTRDYHVKVNVKLVVADTLLTAVVAGNGPDVVLSLGSWFPVNYAMRNAVEDLTQFEDFDEIIKPFYESAILPAEYNGGIYALPETQEFSVLFYRKDVLEELQVTAPDTWDELIALLPTIQGNNMSVGISYPDIATVDLSILNSLIYQNGGQIYDEDGKKTLIDEESGVTAFKLYTSLYNDYGLPTVFDFVSRFRSGEMPIGIANYSVYNTLVVSAPEIRNLWDFTLFPGTIRTDENGEAYIDRSVHSQGLSCMMIATDDEKVKQNAWKFMKWWVNADTQARFGREIESILGSSARYTTANRDALKQLAWSKDELKVLEEQMASTVGFREIAGGYSTTRHMTNAIRRVINTKEDARETLITYARTINEEIRIKRKEFGLPLE